MLVNVIKRNFKTPEVGRFLTLGRSELRNKLNVLNFFSKLLETLFCFILGFGEVKILSLLYFERLHIHKFLSEEFIFFSICS